MSNRQTVIRSAFAAAVLALGIPLFASAQGEYGQWRNYPDYRRDDRYGDRYSGQYLRNAAARVKDRSHDFERSLDSFLDHSRYNGRNVEDRINERAQEFRDAADRFKDRLGNGRDPYRASNEARRMLDLGWQLDSFVQSRGVDNRTMNYWYQIRQDLQTIGNAYGYRGGVNRRDDYYDRYRRNDSRW